MPWRDVKPQLSGPKALRFLGGLVASWFALITPAASADLPELPAQLQEKVENARQACAELEEGVFQLEWGAVDRVDLDGDLNQDWVLNESNFACSTAASLYCGTGGCMSHFLVDGVLQSMLNRGWELVNLGPNKVLLVDVHGSQCGGINPTPCVVASIWDRDERKWRTTGSEWE